MTTDRPTVGRGGAPTVNPKVGTRGLVAVYLSVHTPRYCTYEAAFAGKLAHPDFRGVRDGLVAQGLETSPDRLDGGGNTAEHREVVVREKPDPEARGPGIGYILYRPKSSGFRFSSHSLSFS
jgi:hypothetical protein